MIKRIMDTIDKGLKNVSKLIFFLLLIVATYQVFTRFILQESISWGHEFLIYGFIWLIMIIAPVLVREKTHATITLFLERLQKKPKLIMNLITDLISLGFLLFLFFQAINLMVVQTGMTSPIIKIPLPFVTLSVVVGTFFMLVFFIENIIDVIKHLMTQEG